MNFPKSLETITLPRFYLNHYKILYNKVKKFHEIITRKFPSDVIKDIFKLENEAEREEYFQKYISKLEDDTKEEFKTI